MSVCVPTYQHAPYIGEALDSILMQQTDFSVEILLGEDESTDGTRGICMEYAEMYPEVIRLFLNSRKDVIYVNGRPTGRRNLITLLNKARGKYIAILPGDDYWTSSNKLQKQVNILDTHPNIIACHHWLLEKREIGEVGLYPTRQGYCAKTRTSARDIFLNRVRIKDKTVLFRNVVDENFFPDWFLTVRFGDVGLSFLLGRFGDFYFIDEPMAIYRVTGKGVAHDFGNARRWTPAGYKEDFLCWIDLWRKADRHYGHRYKKEAARTILYFYAKIAEAYFRGARRFQYTKSVRAVTRAAMRFLRPRSHR